jgi:hypothetical protein
VRKLLSSPAIQFKGSGWYITDYARKQDQKADAKDQGAKADAGKEKPAKAGGDSGDKSGTAKEKSVTKASTPAPSSTKE